ncbi:16S rRNA (uracil(1498)-N(3))-methyltransferase [uncultured Corynebacterium sp.]|uniref:16S rRNA (uracil(1498)-N(3))-methyltransferase n=1 Tax=uncultured Corynebacterium sp. TaxID=159447 RepID=UPI0025ED2979|nr:16S rRNA (uracil(1498)-N(3))-methyltransferase [uncultured Corynebacterium sp.]
MTDPVFLVPDLADQLNRVGESGTFFLPEAEARHAAVKRLRAGEPVVLTDGSGLGVTAFFGVGESVTGTGVLPRRTPRPRVTIVQAIPKSERSELAVDLAVQAGADRIIPWQSDRCIAKWDGKPGKAGKARAKWEAAAVSAMKQSRRLDGACVGDLLTDIADLVLPAGPVRLLVLHEEAATPLAQVDLDVEEIVLVIGPEGGVSAREITAVEALGGRSVVLGHEVYRTASAAAIALGAIGVLTDRWAR